MKKILGTLVFLLLLTTCKKQENYPVDDSTLEINDFVWKGMNAYYLWKDKIPALSDKKFNDQSELNEYLSGFNNPSKLFESLIYERETVDHWSWIVDDYKALMNMFSGIRKTTGMRIGLSYEYGSSTQIFAYVKYVIPQSDAAAKGIHRGDIFRKINGIQMTIDNYGELLSEENLQIELAELNGNDLIDTGEIINLQKSVVSENPIFIYKIIRHNGRKTGYLMYNSFIRNYNDELNGVFAYFKRENIDDLVLDLRYNLGGAVSNMQYLASMITGQFTGEVLLRYQWHPQLEEWMEENYPQNLQLPFVDKIDNQNNINHLNLPKVHIIATGNSASASESLINCLNPYIDVIQFGTPTHGKYTASVTLFDSPGFYYYNVNPHHNWALQPIVSKVSNVLGESDFINGLPPDIYQAEDLHNMGILGEDSEPLLQTVLNYIYANTKLTDTPQPDWQEIYYIPQKHMDEMYMENEALPPLNK